MTAIWPADDRLAEIARRAVLPLLAEAGLARWGLGAAEVARALPYLQTARAIDGNRVELLGVELAGEVELPIDPAGVRLGFRVDRLERRSGRLLLTDFKTGNPGSRARTEAGRRGDLMRAVASGKRLQAAVYASAAATLAADLDGESSPPTPPAGRFAYLRPDVEAEARELAVAADDGEITAALLAAVRSSVAALERGALFPRLLDPRLEKTAEVCSHCHVAVACLQHDSGSRLRLASRLGRIRRGEAEPESEAEAALVGLYDLGLSPERGSA